ncbi:hypothetical protein ABEB36_004077 [Hypothenemus hampei]|uniref:Uncharacterized protein n=1 Tax=Hypothenemus hampei TaxID=57062 RepID=A0ABD1F5U7_HYPHA
MVYIGIWGMHKCTIETIPFFLIATGGIGFFSKSSTLAQPPITHYMVDIWWKYIRKAETALYFIEIVLLLFGSFWVFKEFKPHFIPSADPSILYCDKTVYYFAFYYLVAIYFVFGIVIIWYYLVLCCIYAMLLLEHRNT